MNKLAFFPTLLFGLFLTSAGCPKKESEADINGMWTCISIAKLGMLDDIKPTANVDISKKTFGGKAGCNSYFSNVDVSDGGKIAITGIGSTKMACSDGREVIESAFFEAIQSAVSFEIKGDKLVLSGSSGPLAVFSKN